jgi:hypothetical protein
MHLKTGNFTTSLIRINYFHTAISVIVQVLIDAVNHGRNKCVASGHKRCHTVDLSLKLILSLFHHKIAALLNGQQCEDFKR